MKVLWFVNVPPPLASDLMGRPTSVFGGWLDLLSKQLHAMTDVELIVAYPERKRRRVRKGGTTVVTFRAPSEVIYPFKPDVIHLFGTEAPHALDVMEASQTAGVPVVIALQGLVSQIAKFSSGGLARAGLRPTLRDALRSGSLAAQARKFEALGSREAACLSMAALVLGRTDWDRAVTNALAPHVSYAQGHEALREVFYQNAGTWSPTRDSMPVFFMSQGGYPLKGLHIAIEALATLKRRGLKARLKVAGRDITSGIFVDNEYRVARRLLSSNDST